MQNLQKRQFSIFIFLAIVLSALDQVSKRLAEIYVQGTGGMQVIPGIWRFDYVQNRSTAFNLTAIIPESIRYPLLLAIPIITVIVLAGYVLTGPRRPFTLLAVSLIAAGAAGNLIDRFVRGYVVDFIHWYIDTRFDWPVFNLADSLVVVGVVMLFLDTWFAPNEMGSEELETS